MLSFFKRKPIAIAVAAVVKKPAVPAARIALMKVRAEVRREEADTSGEIRRTRLTLENNRLI